MTSVPTEDAGPRLICDAMFGGLARWLRALGYDTAYTPGIDDTLLVRRATDEGRVLLSADSRLFERRVIASGQVRALKLPRGLRLREQVRFVVVRLGLHVRTPRCMRCNGELESVPRTAVADRVPARSLMWATEFFCCASCGSIYWNGTHWRRIDAFRRGAQTWLTGHAAADSSAAD